MNITDCNNHVKSASQFFGPSCAVDSLANIYNPLGHNSGELCKLCASKVLGQKCTARDPYAGYQVLAISIFYDKPLFSFLLLNLGCLQMFGRCW